MRGIGGIRPHASHTSHPSHSQSALRKHADHALSSPKRGFQNTVLLASLSVAPTSRGLGAVVGSRIGEPFVLIAGIHDVNAKSSSKPFDTVDEGEFFYSAEVRWIPTSTPRWTANETKRFDVKMSDDVPMITQERAYTSPIWYTPWRL